MTSAIPPTAWNEMQQIRSCARELGIKPGKAINEYITSNYSKSYVSHIAEAARRARMAGGKTGPEAA